MKPQIIPRDGTAQTARDILPMVSGVHVTDGQLNIGTAWMDLRGRYACTSPSGRCASDLSGCRSDPMGPDAHRSHRASRGLKGRILFPLWNCGTKWCRAIQNHPAQSSAFDQGQCVPYGVRRSAEARAQVVGRLAFQYRHSMATCLQTPEA